MAVLSRDEYFNRLHERVGTDTSEEAITFLEDMTDTYNDMETRGNGDGIDWEQRLKDLDESWKARYQHRFFNGGDRGVPNDMCGGNANEEADDYNPSEVTVDNLFE